MKVAVLGAGVIGITTAYFLAEEGYEVVVIDRQSESAQECSFSNGGQCSFSHVRPWAHPSILPHLFPWLFGDDTPLVFRRFLGWREWRWAASFVRHCTHGHSLTTTENVWRLAHYSKQVLAGIREKEQIEFSHQSKGTLHIFSTQKELDQELKQAEYQRMLGCPYKALDYMGCIRKEPSLQYANQPIVGGVFFPLDETGNVFLFTQALARLCKEKGVTFLYEHAIERFEKSGEKIIAVHTDKQTIKADSYVSALGAYNAPLLRPLGIRLPIYPLKGYSITIPVSREEMAPVSSITDQQHKIVYSRLGNTLRAAGTAELAGYDHTVREQRIGQLANQARRLFPHVSEAVLEECDIRPWSCLRPATPGGRPFLGQTPYENLFLNAGHGTLGWTLSCGSARIIADLIKGKEPEADLSGLTL